MVNLSFPFLSRVSKHFIYFIVIDSIVVPQNGRFDNLKTMSTPVPSQFHIIHSPNYKVNTLTTSNCDTGLCPRVSDE